MLRAQNAANRGRTYGDQSHDFDLPSMRCDGWASCALFDGEVKVVHVERIAAALAMDVKN
jgi:uncharacterized protein (UPF0179 family)